MEAGPSRTIFGNNIYCLLPRKKTQSEILITNIGMLDLMYDLFSGLQLPLLDVGEASLSRLVDGTILRELHGVKSGLP